MSDVRPPMPFQVFCDEVWERMGHEGFMTATDWSGLSLGERVDLIAIWDKAEHRPKEAMRLWDAQQAAEQSA